jgi:4,5-dihydroxyphthalate decarboxylase
MSDLRLSLAINDYVHTADIANGRLRPVGIDFTVVNLPFEAITMRFGANLEFDVAEFSLANYCAALAGPQPAPMVALPIFTSRAFRHSAIYVNEASGICELGDLKDRRVGIPQWSQTATVYLRGYLQHHAGVPLSSIRWVQAGVDQPGRRDPVQVRLPEGVIVEDSPDQTLNNMLLSGSIDAVVSARPPQCIVRKHHGVRRLFVDPRLEEERYFAQTGIFPIMHVVAIRRAVYEANRWIARNIFDAFDAAKNAALARLRDAMTSYLPTAWTIAEMEKTHGLIFSDGNVWPYGLEANRPTLDPFLTYCHEQGLTSSRLQCEELFAPELNFEVRV